MLILEPGSVVAFLKLLLFGRHLAQVDVSLLDAIQHALLTFPLTRYTGHSLEELYREFVVRCPEITRPNLLHPWVLLRPPFGQLFQQFRQVVDVWRVLGSIIVFT
jgi:hypothetical protein